MSAKAIVSEIISRSSPPAVGALVSKFLSGEITCAQLALETFRATVTDPCWEMDWRPRPLPVAPQPGPKPMRPTANDDKALACYKAELAQYVEEEIERRDSHGRMCRAIKEENTAKVDHLLDGWRVAREIHDFDLARTLELKLKGAWGVEDLDAAAAQARQRTGRS